MKLHKPEEDFSELFTDYIVFSYARICETNKVSGGVVVLIKTWLKDYVSQLFTTAREEAIWIKISLTNLGCEKDLIIGAVYIPPERSIFYNDKDVHCGIELVEAAVCDIKNKYPVSDVLVIGDFNARTGEIKDFILSEETDHVPELRAFYDFWSETIVDIDVRTNKDKIVNNFGKVLVHFCCGNDFVILNGRQPPDTTGDFTYISTTGVSTIDYEIINIGGLSRVKLFSVINNDISEHSPIRCEINIGSCCLETGCEFKPNFTRKYKWKHSNRQIYCDVFNGRDIGGKIDEIDLNIDNSILKLNCLLKEVGDRADLFVSNKTNKLNRDQP
ncbi:hypothetical protein SNE40_000522 [Patella caerulea]|uniref:Endonuclease/exonuclease/phosphatase domain-containing protein n=1 Tax=Patella caerulea TaxID=87958 RepID=A0AAN8K5B0_PATCE